MEWQGAINGRGYGQVGFEGRVQYVHRLVYAWANAENPGALHVCHSCDNPRCCNPAHLFLGTHQENHADKARKGRTGKEKRSGELNTKSKLTNAAVREILTSTATGGALARKFGVSRALVNMVRRREIWRHINV
jgi:hypothetical protein